MKLDPEKLLVEAGKRYAALGGDHSRIISRQVRALAYALVEAINASSEAAFDYWNEDPFHDQETP